MTFLTNSSAVVMSQWVFSVTLLYTHLQPGNCYLLLILSTILAYNFPPVHFMYVELKVCVESGAHVLATCWQILSCSSAAKLMAPMKHSLDRIIHCVTLQVCFALNPKETHPNREGAVGQFSYCCLLAYYLRPLQYLAGTWTTLQYFLCLASVRYVCLQRVHCVLRNAVTAPRTHSSFHRRIRDEWKNHWKGLGIDSITVWKWILKK